MDRTSGELNHEHLPIAPQVKLLTLTTGLATGQPLASWLL